MNNANKPIQENCKFCGRLCTTKPSLTLHQKHCKNNPDRVPGISRLVTPETKKKISISMIKLFDEGKHGDTGWTIHKRHEKTYPEIWMESVIKNEFLDKDYISEFRLGTYKLDFAWTKKKLCIEMDGEQHYTENKQIESDIRKDNCLKLNGWKVLRIRWSQCLTDTKKWANIAKNFIDEGIPHVEECQYISKKEQHKIDMLNKYGELRHTTKLSAKEIENRDLLLKPYDKTKFGWVSKAARETGLTRRQIYKYLEYKIC
jgi:very-short-patch-repair endonuclease